MVADLPLHEASVSVFKLSTVEVVLECNDHNLGIKERVRLLWDCFRLSTAVSDSM